MSILNTHDENLPKRKMLTRQEEAIRDNSILDVGQLHDIVSDVVTPKLVSKDDKATALRENWRTRIRVERFTLKNVLGHVDPEIWTAMVNSALRAMEANINISQNNGEWHPMDFECEVRSNAHGSQQLWLGVQWVDTLNEEDMQYRNGQPSFNVNVNSSVSPDLIDALRASAAGNGTDPELKMLLKALTKKLLEDEGGSEPFPG